MRDLGAIHGSNAERYRAFQARFCPFDDGHASRRAADRAVAH
jgi:hypothetical protein